MASVVSGSSADVASSHSKTSGLFANARAIPTRRFCPQTAGMDMPYRAPSKPTRAINSFTRASR